MAEITRFQRYSGKENALTNTTLHLLARVRDYSAHAFGILLNRIAGTADDDRQLEVTPTITQQDRSGRSVTDGRIEQRSFCLLVETKMGASVDRDQLLRHAETFPDADMKILVSVSTHRPPDPERDALTKAIRETDGRVIYSAIDFRQLCDWTADLFAPHEPEMVRLAEDYRAYCREVGVIDDSHEVMRIVPCGQSWQLNAKYGIYYHPEGRGYAPHAYVGVYVNKSVVALWKLHSVFDATLDKHGRLVRTHRDFVDTPEYDEKVIEIMHEAKLLPRPHEIRTGHRFFCGEPFPTDFKKTSKYPIQGPRFWNIKETLARINVGLGSPEQIAKALRNCEWW